MSRQNVGPRGRIQLERPALELRDPGSNGDASLDRLRALGIIAPLAAGPAHAKYELPWPPSVNHYRAIVMNRLITTADGRKFKRDVLAALAAQGFRGRLDSFRKPDRLAVVIAAHAPANHRLDLDNRVKPALDALDEAGLFDDDSQIDDLRIVRCGVVPGGKLVVGVWRLGDVRQTLCF